MPERVCLDALEADLGQAAALRVMLNCGGQRRHVPQPDTARQSRLAAELGPAVARWLADRHGGVQVEFPSPRGRQAEEAAARLRAAVLEAGLTGQRRSANDIAREFGVSVRRVEQIRQDLRRERPSRRAQLPLFDD